MDRRPDAAGHRDGTGAALESFDDAVVGDCSAGPDSSCNDSDDRACDFCGNGAGVARALNCAMNAQRRLGTSAGLNEVGLRGGVAFYLCNNE
jgi:hypothetical protein